MVAASALLFAGKGTLIKYLYTLGAAVEEVMVLRMLFALPVYLWVVLRHRAAPVQRPTRRQWLGVIGAGLCGYYLASYLDMLGLQYISVGLERVIVYTYPAFVVMLAALLWRRRLSPAVPGWIALSWAGLFLVFWSDLQYMPSVSASDIVTGSLLVLLSSVSYAFYVVGAERYIAVMSSAMYTAVAALAATAAMLMHYLILESPASLLALAPPVYAWCLLLALLFTVAPALLLSAGIRRIGSAKAGGIGMVGPLGTLVIAALVLDEPVTLLQVAGLVIVMVAIHRLHRA
jgi:drug/metabolite transporter (DMT)-like permease